MNIAERREQMMDDKGIIGNIPRNKTVHLLEILKTVRTIVKI